MNSHSATPLQLRRSVVTLESTVAPDMTGVEWRRMLACRQPVKRRHGALGPGRRRKVLQVWPAAAEESDLCGHFIPIPARLLASEASPGLSRSGPPPALSASPRAGSPGGPSGAGREDDALQGATSKHPGRALTSLPSAHPASPDQFTPDDFCPRVGGAPALIAAVGAICADASGVVALRISSRPTRPSCGEANQPVPQMGERDGGALRIAA